MATSEFALRLDGVEFRRQGRRILSGVNLAVRPGEKWVLFGPNGVGKSTLVQMMATRAFPSAGSVEILGNRLGKVNVFSYRNRIGLASAELLRTFPSGEDPLDVVLTSLTASIGRWRETFSDEQVARARALMERFGIGYLEGKEMWRLSEGERTRVLICRALMADPDLLLLDEPTTGLDLGGREEVLATLGDIGAEKSGRAVVLVTHRLEEIPAGFDHVAIMGRLSDGRESAEGGADPAAGTILYAGNAAEGLTSSRLSGLFGMPLEVTRSGGRWNAFAASR